MTRLMIGAAVVLAGASIMAAQPPAAQSPAPHRAAALTPAHAPVSATFQPPSVFQTYCFECHGGDKHKGDVSIERLIRSSAQSSIGDHWDEWNKVAEMLETRDMPPEDKADRFPSDQERATTVAWIRGALKAYDAMHAGEPGHVTVRRLTSAEYTYARRDLTGVDLKVGIDASSDSVGGEGFTNFGDVQFVEDTNIERYLEAAKDVADHAVIGAGPLEFYSDPGKTGLELFALNRINDLYA